MPARILVVNTSEDTIEALKEVLMDEGYEVATTYVRDLRLGKVPLESVVSTSPGAIVYDVAPPYEDNWSYYRDVFSRDPLVRGVPVILTTTNAKAASAFAGSDVLELLLKPYDLARLLENVRRALAPADVQAPVRRS